MSLLTQSLKKIINWLQVNAPELVSRLGEGLSNSEINKLIQHTSLILPQEVLEIYHYCNGNFEIAPGLVLHSLKRAIELACDSDWMKGKKVSSLSHILPLLQGDGKDFYYVICEQTNDSSVWCVFVGDEPDRYAASLTKLISTIWECYQTGAYYLFFDKEANFSYIEQDLEKVSKIFQKYNPEQMDTWKYIYGEQQI